MYYSTQAGQHQIHCDKMEVAHVAGERQTALRSWDSCSRSCSGKQHCALTILFFVYFAGINKCRIESIQFSLFQATWPVKHTFCLSITLHVSIQASYVEINGGCLHLSLQNA